MISLPGVRHGALIAFPDDAVPGRLHVVLAQPRIARRPDGSARLQLLRWAGAAGGGFVGARLSADLEIHPDEADIVAAGLAGRDLQPLAWTEARVWLDGPQFGPVEAVPAGVPGATAAVVADLDEPAAALLAPLLEGTGVLPLQVQWSGTVRLRLPPVELIAHVDADELRRRVSLLGDERSLPGLRSVVEANVRLEIRGAADATLEAALRDGALDALAAQLRRGGTPSLRLSAAEVADWPLLLASTLDDFMPADSRRGLVRTMVLGDEAIGGVPPVEVRVLGDFGRTLERVDLRLAALDGPRSAELALLDEAPRLAPLGTRDFRWSQRIKPAGRAAGDWSDWQEVRGRGTLLLSVPVAAARHLEVVASGLDFARRWASVQVQLAAGAQRASVELDAGHTSASWTVPEAAGQAPVQATLAYRATAGAQVSLGPLAVEGGLLRVEDPARGHRLRVALVPAGNGWPEVALAMVDLHHVDGAQVVDETLELRRLEDFVEWETPARADGPRQLQWRLHLSLADGGYRRGEWQTVEAGVIVVRVDGRPRREVQVLPIHFDAAQTRQARLNLRSAAGLQTLLVTDRMPRRVRLDDPGPYTWTLAWTGSDGVEQAEGAPQPGEDVLVLPRYRGGA